MRKILLLVIATAAAVSGVDEWWHSAVIYQIYPRSFKDSNGDGIGDINGITSKLPYLKDIGVDAIWLSPIFLSPMFDFGYDITDYKKIAPEYGTMEDFNKLMAEAKKLGLRVVLDYVINHTSNDSEWFIKSTQRDPNYADYYIWAHGKPDPKNPDYLGPPNNWVSVFRKSAWEYNVQRGQYYLHQFAVGQPDLNFRNAKVVEEMKDVLRFWLEKGVSGIRIDAVNHLYEVDPANHDGHYPDEPLSGAPGATPEDYNYLNHIYTKDQNETYNIVYDLKVILDQYTEKQNDSKIMLTEAYADLPKIMRYYGDKNRNGSVPFNFFYMTELTNKSNARDIKMAIDKWMTHMPAGKVANWVNGNHDQSRLASKFGVDRVDVMNMLALILPGITITYQGEEIGMTDGHISWKDTKDPQACNTEDPVNYYKSSRDPARTPFHWDATANAGFSTGSSTWLPVADNYQTVNVAVEKAAAKSHFKFYKEVVAVKRLPAVRSGDLEVRALCENVIAVARYLPGHPVVVGVINLFDAEIPVDLNSIHLLPRDLQVEASGAYCKLEKGDKVQKGKVTMSPHCALVLSSTQNCCAAPK
ncbi:maltase A3 [Spodoptera frugiperda]|uniref:alpha-glucosidase n=1 Tax=Spodoptera frugiperda TaxID=7108 RepID=A0A9R0DJQ6_SPOFR|nr:maltase A3 [Spodoptera frugiperda]XP_035457138.2 maltase A3 [Spodoptera frugiperda]XP_050557281.1 maltase A3 [Spodoptera frugiperda]